MTASADSNAGSFAVRARRSEQLVLTKKGVFLVRSIIVSVTVIAALALTGCAATKPEPKAAFFMDCHRLTNADGQTYWHGIYHYDGGRIHEEDFDHFCPTVVVVK